MSKEYKPVKQGSVEFKTSKTLNECIKEIAKEERSIKTKRMEEWDEISIIREILDEIADFLWVIIAFTIVVLMFATLCVENPILPTVIVAALITIIFAGITYLGIREDKANIKEDYEKALASTDKELFENAYKFKNEDLTHKKIAVKHFFEAAGKNIISIKRVKSWGLYKFKYIDEHGDVHKTEVEYEEIYQNVNIEGELLVELTGDLKVIIRVKEDLQEDMYDE